MSKFNLKNIMTHAWNIVRLAASKGKKVYIAAAMRKAWTKAKEAAKQVFICGLHIGKATEKAICVRVEKTCCVTHFVGSLNIWLPKSMLQAHANGQAYHAPQWLITKKLEEYLDNANHRSYMFQIGDFSL